MPERKRLVAAVLFACMIVLAGCGRQVATPQVQVEGGLLTALSAAGLTVRATVPEVIIQLQCPSGSASCSVPATIENVPASMVEIRGEKIKERQRTATSVAISLELGPGEGTTVAVLLLPQDTYSFAIVGDTHGRKDTYPSIEKALADLGENPLWLIHLGDMVPSGAEEQYSDLDGALAGFGLPVYAVPGNHDVRGDGREFFAEIFGSPWKAFDYDGTRFILLDDADGIIDQEQAAWLDGQLSGDERKLVFMHIPLNDPRGKDHALPVAATSELESLFAPAGVEAVFSGHIHMYHQDNRAVMSQTVSGGGGGPLYASAGAGGYHHFALVRVSPDGLTMEPVPLELEPLADSIALVGPAADITVSVAELATYPSTTGESAFENNFGNRRGDGTYTGVSVAYLLETVGGMEPGDKLVVTSADGYRQTFSYENVYPPLEWQDLQGDMILAYDYDGQLAPEWPDGARLVFISPDGFYSNDDCLATSPEGEGCHEYLSAGARWARNVISLEVVSGN